MALIFAALYLLHDPLNADGAPLSAILPRQTDIAPALPQDCICPVTRSRWEIVWSCLATIFVCTWVSVHPNIPPLGEPRWKKVLKRLETMFLAIIAPELIIFCAAQQWAAARGLARKYKEYGWTMSHGYFIQMGGFMLHDNDKPIGVLEPNELEGLIKNKKIVMPRTTEEEIQDRSKSDGLSKALVVIQTTWFIGQCIARRIQGLIITELELVTLAFAALNGVMYMYWWFKPLDVQIAIRVDLLPARRQNTPVDLVVVEADAIDQAVISHIPQESLFTELKLTPTATRTETGWNNATGSSIATETEREDLIPSSAMRLYQSTKSSKFQDLYSSLWWLMSGILYRWPATGLKACIREVVRLFENESIANGSMGVPIFYTSYSFDTEFHWEDISAINSSPSVGILFGAIHVVGWLLSFPTVIEANIWRISSATITSVPVIFLTTGIYSALWRFSGRASLLPKCLENNFIVKEILPRFFIIVIVVAVPLYIMARLALLVVALTTLRDLPPEALAVVKWTSFLPHI